MDVICQKCLQTMTLDDKDLQALLSSGQPVALQHEQCPGTDPAPPAGPAQRFFEARLDLVEVFPDRGTNGESEEIASFRATATAPTAAAALAVGGPVMTEFAAKWEKLAPTFAFADQPVEDPS